MNQLNKLIEQYERENPGKKAYSNLNNNTRLYHDEFVEWLASRPTCGKEQRKFLDEVEKLNIKEGIVFDDDASSILYASDFEADLQKVIKGE